MAANDRDREPAADTNRPRRAGFLALRAVATTVLVPALLGGLAVAAVSALLLMDMNRPPVEPPGQIAALGLTAGVVVGGRSRWPRLSAWRCWGGRRGDDPAVRITPDRGATRGRRAS
jgi:hypothetical protein